MQKDDYIIYVSDFFMINKCVWSLLDNNSYELFKRIDL